LQNVRSLLGKQAGKLRFLARFQDQDPVAAQPFSHDDAPNQHGLIFVQFGLSRGIGARPIPVIEQSRKSSLPAPAQA
jgi:hypothetical protein